jgi:hypothetical protein
MREDSLRAGTKWLAGFAVIAGIAATLYLTGFCFSRMQYVGEDEFIANALMFRGPNIKGMPNPVTPEDVRKYREANPKCCRVQGPGFPLNSTFRDRLSGTKTTWVRILHALPDELAVKYKGDTYYEAFIALDRCGRAFRTAGQSLSEDEAKPQM